MDIISILGYLFVACLVGVPILIVLGMIAMIALPSIRNMMINFRLRKTGIQAPAIILSSVTGGRSMTNDSIDGYWVTFEMQVNPVNAPPFKATMKSLVPSPDEDYISPGKKIWVLFDPNDHSAVKFEYFDRQKMMIFEEPEWKLKRDVFFALEQKYQQLRKTGDQATAVIVEREGIIDIGTEYGLGTVYRLKFDVTPKSGQPFRSETQAVILDDKKYAVGREVTVHYKLNDYEMVALAEPQISKTMNLINF